MNTNEQISRVQSFLINSTFTTNHKQEVHGVKTNTNLYIFGDYGGVWSLFCLQIAVRYRLSWAWRTCAPSYCLSYFLFKIYMKNKMIFNCGDELSYDRTKKPTKLSTLRHTLKQKRTNYKNAKKKQNKNKYHKRLHNQIKQTRLEPNLVVNLSNIIPTDSQINVLNKGLRFIPTPKSDTIHTGVKSFLEFKRRMLLKYHFRAQQDKTVPIFRVKSVWEPPEYNFPPLQKYFRHVLKDITDLY